MALRPRGSAPFGCVLGLVAALWPSDHAHVTAELLSAQHASHAQRATATHDGAHRGGLSHGATTSRLPQVLYIYTDVAGGWLAPSPSSLTAWARAVAAHHPAFHVAALDLTGVRPAATPHGWAPGDPGGEAALIVAQAWQIGKQLFEAAGYPFDTQPEPGSSEAPIGALARLSMRHLTRAVALNQTGGLCKYYTGSERSAFHNLH